MTENKLEEVLARRRKARIARFAVGAVLLLAILAWFWLRGPGGSDLPGTAAQDASGSQLPAPQQQAPAPGDAPEAGSASALLQPATPPPAAPELPALDKSDAFVREAVSTLSRHPDVTRWLLSDDLVRRFAAAVDNVAEGRSPRRHVAMLAPKGRFPALGDADEDVLLLADRRGYARYDSFAQAIDALDAKGCARLYGHLYPILQEAFVDLGYPDDAFGERLKQAAAELLAAPVVAGELQLIPQVRRFEFGDPYLESLSDAQKHLVRMGPDNTRRIQSKLRQIMSALEPAWQPPEPRVYRPKPLTPAG